MAERLSPRLAKQHLLEIRNLTDIAEVRRVATRLVRADFNEVETANVALVATELATNLIKHAQDGRILLRLLQRGKDAGLELLALDQGPGIGDLARSMRDGYSTAGSAGTGLGAIKRLAWQFDIYSVPDKGTAIVARLWSDRSVPRPGTEFDLGIVCLPMPGQEVSGDGWKVTHLRDRYTCVLADGLGHGPDAAAAAHAALSTAQDHNGKSPAEIIERAHGVLRSTRGAALAVGEIHPDKKIVRYCAVGNIAARIIGNGYTRNLISYNGIVGQEARKIVEMTYPWSADSLLIMHSDGLSTRWDIRSYPALPQRHPALVAGVLYRDFFRERDDVTVLAARERGDQAS